jgi:AraC-like DNA-binding protein
LLGTTATTAMRALRARPSSGRKVALEHDAGAVLETDVGARDRIGMMANVQFEIEHQTAVPVPALAPLVRRYIGYRYTGLRPGTHLGLPSPDLTVVLSLGPRTRLASMPDPRQRPRAFDALVGGLHTRPAVLAFDTEMYGIELDMTPRGARSLLGVPAGELGSTVISLEEIVGRPARSMLEALVEARTWPERFSLLDHFLSHSLDRRQPARPELEAAWRLLVRSGGTRRVSWVADQMGWGRRHLHESFIAEFGLSPKDLARVTRFHWSKEMLRRDPGAGLATVAAACGYYDQSHLARDWNRLAGGTPSRWLRTDELSFVQDGTDAAVPRLSA